MASLFVPVFLKTIEEERSALGVEDDRGMHDILNQSAPFRPSSILGGVLDHPDERFRHMSEEAIWAAWGNCDRYLRETEMNAHFKVTEALMLLVLLSQISGDKPSIKKITNIGLSSFDAHEKYSFRVLHMREAAILRIISLMQASLNERSELMQRISMRLREI